MPSKDFELNLRQSLGSHVKQTEADIVNLFEGSRNVGYLLLEPDGKRGIIFSNTYFDWFQKIIDVCAKFNLKITIQGLRGNRA